MSGIVVNTNIASMNAQRSLMTSGAELKTAMERLSTGYKINSASDDAAGFAIAERRNDRKSFRCRLSWLCDAAKPAFHGIPGLLGPAGPLGLPWCPWAPGIPWGIGVAGVLNIAHRASRIGTSRAREFGCALKVGCAFKAQGTARTRHRAMPEKNVFDFFSYLNIPLGSPGIPGGPQGIPGGPRAPRG